MASLSPGPEFTPRDSLLEEEVSSYKLSSERHSCSPPPHKYIHIINLTQDKAFCVGSYTTSFTCPFIFVKNAAMGWTIGIVNIALRWMHLLFGLLYFMIFLGRNKSSQRWSLILFLPQPDPHCIAVKPSLASMSLNVTDLNTHKVPWISDNIITCPLCWDPTVNGLQPPDALRKSLITRLSTQALRIAASTHQCHTNLTERALSTAVTAVYWQFTTFSAEVLILD